MMRGRGWLAAIAAVLLAPAASAPGERPVAVEGATLYPRLVAIHHNAALRGRVLLATLAGIRQSRDGVRWTALSATPRPAGTTEQCCGTLYELPARVGALPAGTLLYAATYHLGPRTTIRIFRSDEGVTWRAHGELAAGGSFGKGVWEPQFDLAADGALAAFWSDEGDLCCSQRLRRARSYDGVTWQDTSDLVRGPLPADRPGMATTARLTNGRYAMAYELCGPARCAVFVRFSADGWDYGDPLAPGARVETASGQYLAHAPTIAWSPVAGRPNGALLVVGQMVMERDGAVSPLNGRIVLTNTDAGRGPWRSIAAPVKVPGAYDNFCPNYSSALLPRRNGHALLMVASAYDGAKRCRAYAASTPLRIP